MKTIKVYQSEYNKKIPLEYIGRVKYVGETFGVDSLTNDKIYNVVYDENKTIKIVDDSNEDIGKVSRLRARDQFKDGKLLRCIVRDLQELLKLTLELVKLLS